MAMTAHVVFTAVDPSAPVSVSGKAIREVIRGVIGFDGLLMSDDLSMRALSGALADRARATFAAGCDLALHCNGNMEEMVAVASVAPYLEGKALQRFEAALAQLQEPQDFDHKAAEQARLDSLVQLFGGKFA
jgi:beta-N-acetylhexosaminidase